MKNMQLLILKVKRGRAHTYVTHILTHRQDILLHGMGQAIIFLSPFTVKFRVITINAWQFLTSWSEGCCTIRRSDKVDYIWLHVLHHHPPHPAIRCLKNVWHTPLAVSASKPLRSLATITVKKLKRRFKSNLTSLLEGIFRLPFTQDGSNSELTQDQPYLQGVLMTFLPYPAVVYNEVHLEYSYLKHLVSGSYDVIVGPETNGDKPRIGIEGGHLALHLGSLLEAKSTFTRLWYRQLLLCEAQKVVDKTYIYICIYERAFAS